MDQQEIEKRLKTYYGSFRPSRGQADFAVSSFRDADDFEANLRHEVLGHFGINTFTPGEKRAVLKRLTYQALDCPLMRRLR